MLNLSQNSKTSYGRRTYFSDMTCLPENNLIYCTAKDYFSTIKNKQNIEIENDIYTLKNNNNIYFDLNFEKNKWYYLIFDGRVEPDTFSDYEFGIADSEGNRVANVHTKREKGYFVFDKGLDDIITIKGQDGSWYRRTYRFYSGDNELMYFFVNGTSGQVQIKNLCVCLAENAFLSSKNDNICIREYDEPDCFCADADNLAADIYKTFTISSRNYNFIECKENKIHYCEKFTGSHCIAWFDIKPYHVYTFTVKYRVLRSGNASIGFITEDSDNKRVKTPLYIKCDNTCDDKVESMTFEMNGVSKLGFAVFDGGGEIEISGVYIIPDGKGYDHERLKNNTD